jgi:hypothetical protein
MPESTANCSRSALFHVSGTSAARGLTTSRSNCRATRNARSLAILGRDSPPQARTTRGAVKRARRGSHLKATPGPGPEALHRFAKANRYSRHLTLLKQHIENVLRTVVAEQLPRCLLVIRDARCLDHGQKIPGREPPHCRETKVGILRQVVLPRIGIQVREVAASTPGNQDLEATLWPFSSTNTRRPRNPALIAHMRPLAPPPITITSASSGLLVETLTPKASQTLRSHTVKQLDIAHRNPVDIRVPRNGASDAVLPEQVQHRVR